jgi:hypothetical protein
MGRGGGSAQTRPVADECAGQAARISIAGAGEYQAGGLNYLSKCSEGSFFRERTHEPRGAALFGPVYELRAAAEWAQGLRNKARAAAFSRDCHLTFESAVRDGVC